MIAVHNFGLHAHILIWEEYLKATFGKFALTHAQAAFSYGRPPRSFRSVVEQTFPSFVSPFCCFCLLLPGGFNTSTDISCTAWNSWYYPRTCSAQAPTVRFDQTFSKMIFCLESSNSKLKGYQRVQLSWADGTIVQRLGKKKL